MRTMQLLNKRRFSNALFILGISLILLLLYGIPSFTWYVALLILAICLIVVAHIIDPIFLKYSRSNKNSNVDTPKIEEKNEQS